MLRNAADAKTFAAGPTDTWTRLVSADDVQGKPGWRTVLLQAARGPFDAKIEWSAGNASGFEALISVSLASQISVFATHVTVSIRNRVALEQLITVGCADGQAACENVWEDPTGIGNTPIEREHAVPPFARTVLVGTDGDASLVTVRLYDYNNVVKESFLASSRVAGTYLGGTRKIGVVAPVGQEYRVLFGLTV